MANLSIAVRPPTIFVHPTVRYMRHARSLLTVLLAVPLLLTALAVPAAAESARQYNNGSVLAQATPPKFFNTFGDYIHISSTPPPAASAHGWWSVSTTRHPWLLSPCNSR